MRATSIYGTSDQFPARLAVCHDVARAALMIEIRGVERYAHVVINGRGDIARDDRRSLIAPPPRSLAPMTCPAVPHFPKHPREQRARGITDYIQMIRSFQASEEVRPRQECFEQPRPKNERHNDFGSLRRPTSRPEPKLCHQQQHDWKPKWNANEIVEVIRRKRIGKVWFHYPAVHEINR